MSQKTHADSGDSTPPDERHRDERRHERRYPVVGIAILYSPTEGRCLDNAGQLLREASAFDMSFSGMSFDVREHLKPESELFIEVNDPSGAAERILAEVMWCRKIDDAHFRIGTRIKESATVGDESEAQDILAKPIGKGMELPSEVDFRCPACGNPSVFSLLGLQRGAWKRGVLPLYVCRVCESSRSITSILAYNREAAGH